MAEVSSYWEDWRARRNRELMAGEEDMLANFEQLLAADATVDLRPRFLNRQRGPGFSNVSENLRADLSRLTEKNRELRAALEAASAKEQRSKQAIQRYKEDQTLLSKEVKETFEALLMAKKYYKKHLKLYYTLEPAKEGEHVVFVQFFTERKNENEHFSLRFKRNIKTGQNELLQMTPMLATHSKIRRRLADTNDMPGVLHLIHQCFCMIRK